MFLEFDVLDTTPPANTISEATQLVRAIAVDKEEELDETLPYSQSKTTISKICQSKCHRFLEQLFIHNQLAIHLIF